MTDLLVHGATILTGDPAPPRIDDGYLHVAGTRIAAIGAGEPPGTMSGARIDAREKVVIPGLVNVHTHAILTMVRGVAEDMGFAPAYTPGVPHGHEVTPAEAVALARLGALEALLFGSTLINDTYVHQHLTMPAMGALGLRVWGSGRIHDVDFSTVHLGRWEHRAAIGDDTLGQAIDLHARCHGALDGRLGVQLAAQAPDTCSRGLLVKIREARDRLGLRVQSHMSQSRIEVARVRERDGMSPPELYDDVGLLDDRLLAAHCIHVNDDDVAHIAKGNQTGGTIAPTAALRRHGAGLALGTDNMHADMVEVMRWALCSGRVQEGGVSGAWQPSTVFAMATPGGARAMGLEDEIGSLEVGKKADLVILDYRRPHLVPVIDPLGALVHTAQGRDVDRVIVDGRVVVAGGRALFADEGAIMRDAQRAAEALWARARAG